VTALRLLPLLLASICIMSSPDPAPAQQQPEIAIVNARVWTGDLRRPWADALVVGGERLLQVGSSAEARKMASAGAQVIDAGGRLVVPGFIDSHVHFVDGGFRLSSVQLRDARTPEEFSRRIGAFAATVPPGTWILGGDWDHEQWGGDLPRREWIDSITREHPVFVSRLDGHMALANSLALKLAGVGPTTPEVDGGAIVRDPGGAPDGVLKDNAMSLVWRVVAEPPDELKDRALDAAMAYVAEQGVTSVHNMGSWDDLATFERAHRAGRLRTRIYAAVPIAAWERLRERVAESGRGDDWLRIGALKGFVDGSLGSHTAAMLEPFTDTPSDSGFLVTPAEQMQAWISGADAAGLHPVIHAIGDRANRVLLDIFEKVAASNGQRDRRFRIEHAQHLHPADIPRFASLGVIASMQPYHAIDDGRWAERVIGSERARHTYAFRSLLDAGAQVAFGSDWFVAPPTPLEGIYAAVTRRTLDGANPDGWVPEQKITVEEALRAYTAAGARASFEEDRKGVLARGMLADFVMIDRDITAIPPAEIRDARVVMTVVGGRIVYEALGEGR
jgi:predicted amidohydrolase YtcJ